MKVAQALAQILGRMQTPSLPAIELLLGRVEALLAALGHPQRRLPPVIHVSGTNGKGSLLAYLEAIYAAAGYKAHRYTSPHLLRFNERIRLAGQDITDDVLLAILNRVEAALHTYTGTFFEATTAAAFLAFAEHPADLLLLETGLGGRLDATNIVASPVLTAVMPVGVDHCEFLGQMLAEIAFEKAGIMKVGAPCVIGVQEPEALAVLRGRAAELGVTCFEHGRDWNLLRRGGVFFYRSSQLEMELNPSLQGEHQYANAATVIACCEQLQQIFPVTEAQMQAGLADARWPARLQHLEGGRLAALLPENAELWLDGGHNPHAAEAIARWAEGRRLVLVCAMLVNKDSESFLKILAPHTKGCITLTIPDEPNSRTAEILAQTARAVGMNATTASSTADALAQARVLLQGKAGDVLICGSLYLAGRILLENNLTSDV